MGGMTCFFSLLLARALCKPDSLPQLKRFRNIASLVFALVLIAFGAVFSKVLPEGENQFWVPEVQTILTKMKARGEAITVGKLLPIVKSRRARAGRQA